MENKTYRVLGLMSGSSLDGLDIVCCDITINASFEKPIVDWKLINADTIEFSEMWISRLANLSSQTAYDFVKTNTFFGHYCAQMINDFVKKHELDIDFVAFHGHTIFHYPDKRLTVQIGDGAAMAALTGLPVINDFRTHDIAINGEGAPIAPVVDKMLFQGYDYYLNIGGIANVSADQDGKLIAYDICGANQILNALARKLNMEYDANGTVASGGKLIDDLFEEINNHPYLKRANPKSLDNNQVFHAFTNRFLEADGSWQNKLTTATKHIAYQIGLALDRLSNGEQKSLFITGGGAFNSFLIESLAEYAPNIKIVVPEPEIVNYKEGILMALMGVLRAENLPNCFATVTGADIDTIGGAIYQGTNKII